MDRRILLAAGVALPLLLTAGCGGAEEIRDEAEEAETRGDHDRAMERLDRRRDTGD
ncbi:hypothetical protein [Thiohalospira sp.]|uniref:hypothetical protein n=1 Tax=Thiohalospira sp. TaxID=3080549 RepID=UPI0039816AEB